MLPSPTLYYAFLALCSIALAVACCRVDRVLGWIVIFALAVNLVGAGLMGWWVQRVHGRQFTAGDEVGFQHEGARLLDAWRRGDTSLVRTTVGVYAPINAVVIAVAGPGQTPMRLTTAIVGATGVGAAFWLASLLYRSLMTARLAALLCATSPLLILYSWANLRDRWIGVAGLLVLIAIVLATQRLTWRRAVALMASIVVLGELRHYWATLLGYLAIAGCFLTEASWWRRLSNTVLVTFVVGVALWSVTETFLGLGIRFETPTKYVTLVPRILRPAAPAQAGESLRPDTSGGEDAVGSSGANPAAPPFSGPTLGEAQAATKPKSVSEAMRNIGFVLFGRVRARADGGQYASLFLLPEALWSLLLFPLAIVGVVFAVRGGQRIALVPAAYVCAVVAVLSWLRGDDWNTYRFRGLYWGVLLVFAAGGLSWLFEVARLRLRGRTVAQR